MAIVDFPTTRAFKGARFSLWVNTSERAFTGFFTGNRTTRSNSADRLGCLVSLPPVGSPLDAAAREAWLLSLRSTGDHVRFGMPHRPLPLGTLRGSPTVSTSAIAGARSLVITGGYGTSLITGGSFEFDTNADGIADGWSAVQGGSITSAVYSRTTGAPQDGTYEQGLTASFDATGIANRVGIERTVALPGGAGQYTAFVSVRGDTELNAVIFIEWRNSGGTVISDVTVVEAAVTTGGARIGATVTAPAGTTQATLQLLAYRTTGAASRSVRWDVAGIKSGATDLSWPGGATLLGGDFIGVGGNLLQVAYAGALALDSGQMTIPLTTPLQKAISGGAAVTVLAPTGVWELDDLGLQVDYTAPIVQGPVVLRFRQVPQ